MLCPQLFVEVRVSANLFHLIAFLCKYLRKLCRFSWLYAICSPFVFGAHSNSGVCMGPKWEESDFWFVFVSPHVFFLFIFFPPKLWVERKPRSLTTPEHFWCIATNLEGRGVLHSIFCFWLTTYEIIYVFFVLNFCSNTLSGCSLVWNVFPLIKGILIKIPHCLWPSRC